MGFLDKFKNAIGTAADAINKSLDSASDAINKSIQASQKTVVDPLADPVIKEYFEIICGMSKCLSITGPESATEFALEKKYVEYFLGEACDEQKLQRTLALYNSSLTDYPKDETQKILSNYRKSLKDSTNYTFEKHEAYKIFCQDEIKETEIEYDKILDVIRDNVNYKHFSQGLQTLHQKSPLINIAIANSFNNGNPITQKLVLDYLVDSIVGRMNNDTYIGLNDVRDDIALIALKALRFEKYGKNKEAYPPIADEEYRDFVLNVPRYRNFIDDYPFEREKYTMKCIDLIKRANVFYWGPGYKFKNCYRITCVDDYFCDALCNLAWKAIDAAAEWGNKDGENINKSQKAEDVFGIMNAYFDRQEQFDELEIVPLFQDEDVEVYDTISDETRSLLGTIDLEDEEI